MGNAFTCSADHHHHLTEEMTALRGKLTAQVWLVKRIRKRTSALCRKCQHGSNELRRFEALLTMLNNKVGALESLCTSVKAFLIHLRYAKPSCDLSGKAKQLKDAAVAAMRSKIPISEAVIDDLYTNPKMIVTLPSWTST